MSLNKEKSNNSNITRYYELNDIKNNLSAIRWISDSRKLSGFFVNYIYLCDLQNRFDEGSTNIQLDPDVSYETIIECYKNRDIDLIYINGSYNGKPVVIGTDLRKNLFYITLRKKSPADIDSLERELALVK